MIVVTIKVITSMMKVITAIVKIASMIIMIMIMMKVTTFVIMIGIEVVTTSSEDRSICLNSPPGMQHRRQ